MTLIATAAEDPERRKVRRMNNRNQLDDASTALASAIENFTQTYIDVVTELELEPDDGIAHTLTHILNAAAQATDQMEKQLDRDLMREQKENNQ